MFFVTGFFHSHIFRGHLCSVYESFMPSKGQIVVHCMARTHFADPLLHLWASYCFQNLAVRNDAAVNIYLKFQCGHKMLLQKLHWKWNWKISLFQHEKTFEIRAWFFYNLHFPWTFWRPHMFSLLPPYSWEWNCASMSHLSRNQETVLHVSHTAGHSRQWRRGRQFSAPSPTFVIFLTLWFWPS